MKPVMFTFPITTVGFVVSVFKDVSALEIVSDTARCIVSVAREKQVIPAPAVTIMISNNSLYILCITGVFEFIEAR